MAKKGGIQVYTGDGKGKTTAALGLAMRAVGQGMKVVIIQFTKGIATGEHRFIAKYHPFDIVQISVGDSLNKSAEQLRQEAQQTLEHAEQEMFSSKCDIVILDEILWAVSKELISVEQMQNLFDKKPESVELVLTGRNAPKEIIQRADLVTEMLMIKHPYTKGVEARRA